MAEENAEAGAVLAAIEGIGPLARRLNQAHTRLWYDQVHQDLTGPQFTVLSLLHAHGAMDQGTLGALAHLDKSTAAPLLDRLRRRGLVEFAQDEADRRRKLVSVTDEGRSLAEALAPAVMSVGEQLLDPLSPEEREVFLGLLRRTVRQPRD
ncbi:MarR family winged helix-turn-helix transcriptional regulator [Streptomyces sp. NPDC004111]|uniref:MarR family winged helix-turn-helix transcriptional regulator n=1 Tax=Streptomyces sp. NPDC004111 TaxID=3364690 RepID=UPI00367D0B64